MPWAWPKKKKKRERARISDKEYKPGEFLVVQWVNDPALPQLWLRLLLWCGFYPWPGNFHMLWVQPKK